MNFAIIAAGEGSRLKMEGLNVPKPLVKIGDTPMVYRIINSALQNGANSISIIINESAKELKDYLDTININVPLNIVIKSTPSSMHSLFELSKFLNDEPFFLATTDSIYKDDEFKEYVRFCKTHKEYDAILAVTEFVDDEKPLSVKINSNFEIINFDDSIGDNKFVTGGLYFFRSLIFSEMDSALNSGTNRLRNFLRLLLKKEYKMRAFAFSKMIDVDHVNDIKTAEEFLFSSNKKINY